MKKYYCLICAIGRSQSIVFKSEPFDATDGDADIKEYRAACEARKNKDAELSKTGRYLSTYDNRIRNISDNHIVGRLEIERRSVK